MKLTKQWVQEELYQQELAEEHRPPQEEYRFYQAVRQGDLAYVEQNCNQKVFGSEHGMGQLSHNRLQNIKYHFVVTAALVTRYCITGGMAVEQAYRMSDFYILQMDGCTQVSQVIALHNDMVLDFTTKMALQRSSATCPPVSRCLDYIYTHIQERITVQDLAEYTGLSTGYISRIFKQNTGVSVSEYIRCCKIDKARQMLQYTQESLVEISNYLAFSSQSQFIQLFRERVGMTPKKYRDQYYKSVL